MSFVQRLGDATTDQLKAVWSVVPLGIIRLTGGHGTWTDPLTHATLTDAQSDLRKSAVVASAIGAFNDQNNFWYDMTTQQHLLPADTYNRWQQKFGSATFAQAYGSFPSQFAIFAPTTSLGDPAIHAPGAIVAPSIAVAPAVPVATVPTVVAPVPITSASATPQQIAAAGAAAAPAPVAAASTSTLLWLGVAVGAFVLFNRSHRR